MKSTLTTILCLVVVVSGCGIEPLGSAVNALDKVSPGEAQQAVDEPEPQDRLDPPDPAPGEITCTQPEEPPPPPEPDPYQYVVQVGGNCSLVADFNRKNRMRKERNLPPLTLDQLTELKNNLRAAGAIGPGGGLLNTDAAWDELAKYNKKMWDDANGGGGGGSIDPKHWDWKDKKDPCIELAGANGAIISIGGAHAVEVVAAAASPTGGDICEVTVQDPNTSDGKHGKIYISPSGMFIYKMGYKAEDGTTTQYGVGVHVYVID